MVASTSHPRSNQWIVGLIFLLLSIAPFTSIRWWLLPALLLAGLLAVKGGSAATLHLAVLAFLTALAPRLFSSPPPFLVAKAAPLVLYAGVVVAVPALRRSLDWLRPGRMNRKSWLLVMLVVAVSAIALFAWTRFATPNLTGYARLVPDMPTGLLPVYVAIFALVNSLAEELFWRGAMLASLDSSLGAGALAVALQALQFGIAHYRGPFLYGWLGVALTGIFGWMLGGLFRRTGGLIAGWLSHAAADFTILLLVVLYSQSTAG